VGRATLTASALCQCELTRELFAEIALGCHRHNPSMARIPVVLWQSYADVPHNPNYWWPEDRAWCVVTDTDDDWACVAGTRSRSR
jgi:hypothetical protein